MRRKRIATMCCLLTVLSLNAVATYATELTETKEELGTNSDDYFFDITSIGGKIESEKTIVYNVTPEEKTYTVNTSLESEKAEEFFSEDLTAVETVKEQDEIALRKLIRDEKIEKASWLLDYEVKPDSISNERLDVLNEAKKWVGSWYVWGGSTPPKGSDWTYGNGGGGFDCSGYTQYVLRETLDIHLPRTTYSQIGFSGYTRIPISQAQPGDIVFGNGGGHTGFFIRDNGNSITLLHSPERGRRVQISRYHRPKYAYRYID